MVDLKLGRPEECTDRTLHIWLEERCGGIVLKSKYRDDLAPLFDAEIIGNTIKLASNGNLKFVK